MPIDFTCLECKSNLDLIEINKIFICGNCKELYLQKLRENIL